MVKSDFLRDDRISIGNESSLALSRFNPGVPTKIIIHGWTHGKDVPWVVELREVLADKGLWNVIVVDWTKLSHVVYTEARIHNMVVSKQLTEFILFLVNLEGIPLSSIHLIGHSMGAQIAAVTGLNIKREAGLKIGRITALDPAAPLYEWPHLESLDEIIDPSDAQFVDVIHTNGRHLGMMTPAGHVDYYPNGGENQIGCRLWVCSHMRACEYFIASVQKPDLFNAISFKCWKEYQEGKINYLDAYPMGIAANPHIPSGIYYVRDTQEYLKYTTTRTSGRVI
ncbi:hypothetical protein JTB14_013230 [Gonioctena quinquepunctata]|nr:hypothetical protein JTB14_013230 [Gonioctena quinquepunctata]